MSVILVSEELCFGMSGEVEEFKDRTSGEINVTC